MMISFLQHIEYPQRDFIDKLQNHVDSTYPHILLLMNFNGTILSKKKKGITMREGYQSFIKLLMEHPRIKFAFISNLISKYVEKIMKKIRLFLRLI